jgi:LuxR family maltose regulon positive regulatory protein
MPPNKQLIFETKLQKPDLPSDFIKKQKLIDYVNEDLHRSLTLVSAGGGFGKSTFVSSWFNELDVPHAWLYLDDFDNDVRVFLYYFISSIRKVISSFGDGLLILISASELPPVDILSKSLVNELNSIEELFVFALDDFHLINNQDIIFLISSILKYPLHNFHLVLITRIDPALPLVKLRSRGKVKDVRSSHLQFSKDETLSLLNANIENEDTEKIANVLFERLEGWIAGLRLALIHMSFNNFKNDNLGEISSIRKFSEGYFIEEVIHNLKSEKILDFLQRTSIFQKFSSGQLSYVLGLNVDECNSIIQKIIVNNIFIVNLDNNHLWYRYHHLLQEVLRTELTKNYSIGEIEKLHLKAVDWYEKNGFIDEAFYHAEHVSDRKVFIELLERNMHNPLNEDKWYVLESWLKNISDDEIEKSPTLIIARLWVLQHKNAFWAFLPLLEKIKKFTGLDLQTKLQIDFFEGVLLFWNGEVQASLSKFEYSFENVSRDKIGVRSLSRIYLATALQMSGRGEEIYKEIQHDLFDNKLEGTYRVISYGALQFMKLIEGNLLEARQLTDKIDVMTDIFDDHFSKVWSVYMKGYISYNENKLFEARDLFTSAIDNIYLLNMLAPIDNFAGLLLTLKYLKDDEGYRVFYEKFDNWKNKLNNPIFISTSNSVKARLALLDSDIDLADKYMRLIDVDIFLGNTTFSVEYPPITKCKVLIAQGCDGSLKEAELLLARIEELAVKTKNVSIMIELLVEQAKLNHKKGNKLGAISKITEAIDLALQGGAIQPFIESGHIIVSIIKNVEKNTRRSKFVDRIIGAIPESKNEPSEKIKSQIFDENFMKRLSNRELDVVNLLALRLTNKEIADKLKISVSTVKRHTITIYQKLDVNNRRDAVNKAEILNILD